MSKTQIDPERLREILADDERRLAYLDENIEKQERFIQNLEAERQCDSTPIETARQLLGTMKCARAGFIAERFRIMQLIKQIGGISAGAE